MKVVCFDLDDTLYKEVNYLHSAYRDIAQFLCDKDWESLFQQMLEWYEAGRNVFDRICEYHSGVEKSDLLNMYRYDTHPLALSKDVYEILNHINKTGIKTGLITDGRTVTQMNKIKALRLDRFFDDDMIVISEAFGSEKPSERNYQYFMDKFPECSDFTYVGDNPYKDFITANLLGWNTICLLDDGRNIHKQNFDLPKEFLPKVKIGTIPKLSAILL